MIPSEQRTSRQRNKPPTDKNPCPSKTQTMQETDPEPCRSWGRPKPFLDAKMLSRTNRAERTTYVPDVLKHLFRGEEPLA